MATLREQIEQQRNTIEALRREGHDCPDAERHLRELLAEDARRRNLVVLDEPPERSRSVGGDKLSGR